ncbi:macro domain-containing protein [Duganella sp. Dugasp56]|uniref:macro domain-containing protein n=1 Tax=Duganella sp. Dugasp56 TaxID=3243046 RepID=UPI0039AF71DB
MEIINDLKTSRFWRHFLVKAFAVAGGLSGLIQFNNAVFPSTAWTGNNVLWTVIAISFVVGILLAWPRPIMAEYSSPKTKITIVKGDLLEEKGHIVIGASDTFDTEPPNIIARQSLQGQVLDRLYGGNLALLDQHIDEALRGYQSIGSIQKAGKNTKYNIGTVAVVTNGPRKLFFSAYSEMNDLNESRATPDTVWKSLQALWSSVSVHGNGTTISIPVIGGGQARLSSVMPAQDSIRFIALSFMMASRRERICDELRIIVRSDDYQKLDRLEIQSFISSLRPS